MRLLHNIACLILALAIGSVAAQAADSVADVDRALAAVASGQSSESAKAILTRGQARSARAPDTLANRDTIAVALDQVRAASQPGGLQLTQASLLVNVMSLLDSIAVVEAQRGIANALPTLKDALWETYLTPALAATRVTIPLAKPLSGRLVGQWVDGRKSSVRIFDLWGDPTAKTLAWSRDEFADPMPDPDRVIARQMGGGARAPKARLALYLDLAELSDGDREIARSAKAREDGDLLLVLDDTARRVTLCLEESGDGNASLPETSRPGGKAKARSPEKAPAVFEVLPREVDAAEQRCRRKAAPDDLAGQAILFDPVRRVRVLESRLGSDAAPLARVLARAAAFARVWP